MDKKTRKKRLRDRKNKKRPIRPIHKGKDESFEINKIVAGWIEEYWPYSNVRVFPEIKGIDKPDILITLNGLKIPVEVKTRKHGYFFIYSPRYGNCQICHNHTTENIVYTPIPALGTENFSHQVVAMLKNYGISLFLVNARVRPKTPVYGTEDKGLVILSELDTLYTSLDRAYGFLDSRR